MLKWFLHISGRTRNVLIMICNWKGENPKILHVLPAICAGKGLSSCLFGKFTFCSFRKKKNSAHYLVVYIKQDAKIKTHLWLQVVFMWQKSSLRMHAVPMQSSSMGARYFRAPPPKHSLWMFALIIWSYVSQVMSKTNSAKINRNHCPSPALPELNRNLLKWVRCACGQAGLFLSSPSPI